MGVDSGNGSLPGRGACCSCSISSPTQTPLRFNSLLIISSNGSPSPSPLSPLLFSSSLQKTYWLGNLPISRHPIRVINPHPPSILNLLSKENGKNIIPPKNPSQINKTCPLILPFLNLTSSVLTSITNAPLIVENERSIKWYNSHAVNHLHEFCFRKDKTSAA